MNPYSGDIEMFSSMAEAPKGWLELTNAEAREYLTLPLDLRLQHYIKARRTEKCKTCGCFVGNHSLRVFKECAANELARFDIERLEAQLAEGQPKMPDVSELFAQLPARTLEEATDFHSLREAHKRRYNELSESLTE